MTKSNIKESICLKILMIGVGTERKSTNTKLNLENWKKADSFAFTKSLVKDYNFSRDSLWHYIEKQGLLNYSKQDLEAIRIHEVSEEDLKVIHDFVFENY